MPANSMFDELLSRVFDKPSSRDLPPFSARTFPQYMRYSTIKGSKIGAFAGGAWGVFFGWQWGAHNSKDAKNLAEASAKFIEGMAFGITASTLTCSAAGGFIGALPVTLPATYAACKAGELLYKATEEQRMQKEAAAKKDSDSSTHWRDSVADRSKETSRFKV